VSPLLPTVGEARQNPDPHLCFAYCAPEAQAARRKIGYAQLAVEAAAKPILDMRALVAGYLRPRPGATG
jgi:hypothetical protein